MKKSAVFLFWSLFILRIFVFYSHPFKYDTNGLCFKYKEKSHQRLPNAACSLLANVSGPIAKCEKERKNLPVSLELGVKGGAGKVADSFPSPASVLGGDSQNCAPPLPAAGPGRVTQPLISVLLWERARLGTRPLRAAVRVRGVTQCSRQSRAARAPHPHPPGVAASVITLF